MRGDRRRETIHESILSSGLLPEARRRVYMLLWAHGPLTGREINFRLSTQSGHKRLSELKRLDIVDTFGKKKCSSAGRLSEAWDVSGRPISLNGASTPDPRKKIFDDAERVRKLARVLRVRPIPKAKESAKNFLDRYHIWSSAEVSQVADLFEEESDAE